MSRRTGIGERCQGKTDDGLQCRRLAVKGRFCEKHQDQGPYSEEIVDKYKIDKPEEVERKDAPLEAFLEYLEKNTSEQVVTAFKAVMAQNEELHKKLKKAETDYQSAIQMGVQAQAEASPEEIKKARMAAGENLRKARMGASTDIERQRQDQQPRVKVTRMDKEFTVMKGGERKWASIVQINGVSYLLIAGEETEVPQCVADFLRGRDQTRMELDNKMQRVQGLVEYETLRQALEE